MIVDELLYKNHLSLVIVCTKAVSSIKQYSSILTRIEG